MSAILAQCDFLCRQKTRYLGSDSYFSVLFFVNLKQWFSDLLYISLIYYLEAGYCKMWIPSKSPKLAVGKIDVWIQSAIHPAQLQEA